MSDLVFNIDVDNITEDIQQDAMDALAMAFEKGDEYARALAKDKAPGRHPLWEHGFRTFKVNDNLWVFELQGKLAEMIDDGYNDSQIKEMLLSGYRSKFNKKNGKAYVDVPMGLKEKNGQVGGISVQVFKDANALMSQFKKTEHKTTVTRKPGQDHTVQRTKSAVKTKNEATKRVGKVIQNKINSLPSNTKFMTITRVSRDSKGWSKNHPGLGIMSTGGDLEKFVEDAFYTAMAAKGYV